MRVAAATAALICLAGPAWAQVGYSVAGTAVRPAFAATAAGANVNATASSAGLRLLTWPGKTGVQGPRPAARPAPAPMARLSPPPGALPQYRQPMAAPVTALPTSIYSPPPPPLPARPSGMVQARANLPPAAPAGAQPSIQPSAAAQPAAVAMAAADPQPPGPPRFYSVQRAYGGTPDPNPLPPQFFGGTTDLAQPPPPPPRQVTTASGQVLRAAPADPDSDPAGN